MSQVFKNWESLLKHVAENFPFGIVFECDLIEYERFRFKAFHDLVQPEMHSDIVVNLGLCYNDFHNHKWAFDGIPSNWLLNGGGDSVLYSIRNDVYLEAIKSIVMVGSHVHYARVVEEVEVMREYILLHASDSTKALYEEGMLTLSDVCQFNMKDK